MRIPPRKGQESTRRQFLAQTTGAATSTLFVPYFLSSSSANAADGGDDLNVAAIGVGGRGSTIGHQAGELGNMVACADVDRQNAEKFATPYEGKCEIHEDYRHILDRKDIDVITCGTPDHWHTKIITHAMRAGKDVYCEKPLTLTIDESRQINQITRETGRVVQVGTQQRSEFKKAFLKAVAIARGGHLGDKLHAISSVGPAEVGGPFETQPPPEHLNFDFWLGQSPKVEYCPERVHFNFRWFFEYSGGQVTDWGVHHTDIALWALGGEETGIVAAQGSGVFPGLPYTVNIVDYLNGHAHLPNGYNVAHEFDCDLTLANGNTIKLISGTNELIISGDKGRIRVNRGGLTGKSVEEITGDPESNQKLDEEVQKLYRGMPIPDVHMANFFHCVKTREMPISDVWSHSHAVNACHIANIAMLLKRQLTFDSQKNEFVDDDEANLFIRREQRSPWQIDV